MHGIKKIPAMYVGLERMLLYSTSRRMYSSSNSSTESTFADKEISKIPVEFLENPKVPSLLEVTSKLGIYVENVMNSLKLSPVLLNSSPEIWEKSFRDLTSYGFSKRDCLRMITAFPELLKVIEEDQLQTAMANWMNCQLGYDNMLDLLATHPNFIPISAVQLNKRIPLLRAVTKSRGKNLTRLLRGCPSLIYQDWREVEAKINYVEHTMKIDIDKENLSRCYMFNRALDDIKIRHKFLERAGIYITPKKVKGTKKQQMQQPWSNNPHITKITDTSEEAFISKVAIGLTMEEFEVFKEMYKEELNEKSGSEDDLSDDD